MSATSTTGLAQDQRGAQLVTTDHLQTWVADTKKGISTSSVPIRRDIARHHVGLGLGHISLVHTGARDPFLRELARRVALAAQGPVA